MRHTLILIPVCLLLMACNPQRHLQKARVYVKGSPPVQIMAVRPETMGADLDPMRYTSTFMQLVEDRLKEESMEVEFVGMGENVMLSKSSTFVIEVGMVMVQEQIEPSPNPEPEAAMAASLQVNLSAGLLGIDKKNTSTFNDYHIVDALGVEEQAQFVKKDPNTDVFQVAMQKGIDKLIVQVKEQMLAHMKANKSNL